MTNQWTIAILAVTFIVGLFVCGFGVLIAMFTALGNRKRWWGTSIIFLGPISGIPYTLLCEEAEYSRSLMNKGTLLILPRLVFYLGSKLMT